MFGLCLIFMRFSASWSPQHESQKNLFRWQSISLALNCRRHAVTDEFCSMSIERSRKDSSREDTCCNKPDHRGTHRPARPSEFGFEG